MRISLIVVAAGRGERLGSDRPKQFLPLAGIPLLIHTLRRCDASTDAGKIIVAIPAQDTKLCEDFLQEFGPFVHPIVLAPGGQERQDSVRSGLGYVDEDCEVVALHDGVRPFVTGELIDRVVRVAGEVGGAVAAIPLTETVKVVDQDGWIVETSSRRELWLAQTPQAFRTNLLREAYLRAYGQGFYATDDAGLVERVGGRVKVILGDAHNIKITTPADFLWAELFLQGKR